MHLILNYVGKSHLDPFSGTKATRQVMEGLVSVIVVGEEVARYACVNSMLAI